MEYKVIISGFGGQGVLFAGKILAEAALLSGLNTSWLPSYGPEMRGGTCNCRVIVSDREISSPAVSRADALIALNRPSARRFSETADKVIITDKEYASDCVGEARILGADLTVCRSGELAGLANIIMLGGLAKAGGVDAAALRKALSRRRGSERNIRALDAAAFLFN